MHSNRKITLESTSPMLSRRAALGRVSLAAAATLPAGALLAPTAAAEADKSAASFRFCLNTATLRGHKLGIVKEIEIVAQAGYQAIEPWIDAIDQYAKSGSSMKDLKQRIADLGLVVESAVGFPEWLADDDARRAKGMERAKSDMDMVAQLGGKRLAAPPAGATNSPLDISVATERYRALLEAGDQVGVVPQLEIWGMSKRVNRLAEAAEIAIAVGHRKACVLADVFHLYKGGSGFDGLRLLSANALQVLHMNDYPAEPPRTEINDSYRVYPGDGVAPFDQILRDLHSTGGTKVLSFEVFNRQYWEQDPLVVAKTGLAKMKAAVAKALS